MARPLVKNKNLHMRLSEEDMNQLKDYCNKKNITVTDFIMLLVKREILKDSLEERGIKIG